MFHMCNWFLFLIQGILTTQVAGYHPSVTTIQPVVPVNNLTINVTGYQDKHDSRTTVFMQPLTWFEASQECKRANYGTLWTDYQGQGMYNVIDHLLLTLGPYSNVAVWVDIFRPNVNSTWISEKCRPQSNMNIANPTNPGQCLSTYYNVSSQAPIQLIQDCSVKLASVCRKFFGNLTHDEYPGYDYQNLPNTTVILTHNLKSLDECKSKCFSSEVVVGGTYENTTQWCRLIKLKPFTGQYLNYTIASTNDTSLIHFVIVSRPGTAVPANSSYQPLPTDNMWPSCAYPPSTALPTSTSGSSTIPTVSTTTSAEETTSLPTSTYSNNIFQTTSTRICTNCCHLNGTQPNTVKLTELSDTLNELVRNLTVTKTSTSKYRRQLTSAEDDRPSSIATGTIAVSILASIGLTIFLSDLASLKQHCVRRYK